MMPREGLQDSGNPLNGRMNFSGGPPELSRQGIYDPKRVKKFSLQPLLHPRPDFMRIAQQQAAWAASRLPGALETWVCKPFTWSLCGGARGMPWLFRPEATGAPFQKLEFCDGPANSHALFTFFRQNKQLCALVFQRCLDAPLINKILLRFRWLLNSQALWSLYSFSPPGYSM